MIIKLLKSQFVIYGVIGSGITLIKLLSLYTLRDIFEISTYLSVTVSYIITLIMHFFINKHYTFKIDERKIINMMTVRYLVALFISFAFYFGNIWMLNQVIKLSFYIAEFLTLFLSFIFNYFLYKKFVFVDKFFNY